MKIDNTNYEVVLSKKDELCNQIAVLNGKLDGIENADVAKKVTELKLQKTALENNIDSLKIKLKSVKYAIDENSTEKKR